MNFVDSVSFCLLANEINKVYEKSQLSLSRFFPCDSDQFARLHPTSLNGIEVATMSLVHELLFFVHVQSRIVVTSVRRSPFRFPPEVLNSKEKQT